jgi:sugar phosphate isomerase/epimerase
VTATLGSSDACVVTGAFHGAPLDEALRAIAAAGATAVEVTIEPGAVRGELVAGGVAPDGIGAVVDASGLRLLGLAATAAMVPGHPGLPRALALADDLGAGFVRVFPPVYDADRPAGRQLAEAARALARVAAAGDRARLLVEPGPGTVAPSPELARRLVDEADDPSVAVLYDPANMLAEGHLHPAYAIDLLGDRLVHVHVKNVLCARRVDGSGLSYVTLGEGDVDWPETVRLLRASGYDGAFSIDHLSGPPTAATLADDVRGLRHLLERAGRPVEAGAAAI